METCLHFINTQKRSKKDCSNDRGISVTSVISRVYSKILRELLEEKNKDVGNEVDFEQEDHVQTTSSA